MITSVVVALAVLNAISFAMFGLDKRRARRGQWRISERALLASALISGTLGAWMGMRAFDHKTRKRAFTAAMAGVSAIDALVVVAFVSRGR